MQDQPPLNRAERRAQGRKRGRPPKLLRPQSQSNPLDLDTGIGSDSEASEPENPVSGFIPFASPEGASPKKRGRPAAANKQTSMRNTLVSYYALMGLGVGRFDEVDGQLIVANAESCADAWMAAGKANANIQHALELITIAGPYTALVTIHASLVLLILEHHKANPLRALFGKQQQSEEQVAVPAAKPEPAPLPYTPVGANAPTEAAPPPTFDGQEMRIFPDEGLPADLDVMLRQAARQTGRPYEELYQEAMVAYAQQQMKNRPAGALGAQVARD
jgi:hypothetical protein